MSKVILRIRETFFTVFVFNLPTKISDTEVKAMFYWAGRIVDVFLPRVRSTGDTSLLLDSLLMGCQRQPLKWRRGNLGVVAGFR